MHLIVNKSPQQFRPDEVKRKVEDAYNCPVLAVLQHSDDMMMLASEGVFSLHYPENELTSQFKGIAGAILELD
jgi:MinD-like ATPase involved in chromosome partitioning or flagellar assembly